MQRIDSIAELGTALAVLRLQRGLVGFVPTMGALHDGHASLIERARRECGTVVVSVFVNPLQFDRKDDLERYPRTLDADAELCRSLGADVLFTPAVSEMYPTPPLCRIDVGPLGAHLCGARRPGHFDGVALVVMKLLQVTGADRAYFGEKDAQQLAIIRRMVADFNVPVQIIGVPTVREPDGLALSSRNRHLGAEERRVATVLYKALRHAQQQIESGATDAAAVIADALTQVPENENLRVEYLEIVSPEDLQPVQSIEDPVLVAGALWVGATRLIDNVLCNVAERHPSR